MRIKSFAIVAALALSTAIAGCSTIGSRLFSNDYGAVTDAGYQLPRIPIEKVPLKYHRQTVRYDTKEKPGTIVVDTQNKFLHHWIGPDRRKNLCKSASIGLGERTRVTVFAEKLIDGRRDNSVHPIRLSADDSERHALAAE